MPWSNPLVAGTTLIRTAIKSPNYVAGVSGWSINKDGTVEFSAGTFRGDLSASNGTVLADSTGFHVIGTDQRYDLTKSGGIVIREVPDSGGYIVLKAVTGFGGVIYLQPIDSTTSGVTFTQGVVYAARNIVGTDNYPYTKIISPRVQDSPSDLEASYIQLTGQSSDSATPNQSIAAYGDFDITGNLSVSGIGNRVYTTFGTMSVTNSVTMSYVTDAIIDVLANATYMCRLWVAYNGPTAADARWSWGITGTITGERHISAPAATTASNVDTNMTAIRRGFGTEQVTGTPNGTANAYSIYEEMSIWTNATSSDEIAQLAFAQGTANATPSVIQSGYLIIERIA